MTKSEIVLYQGTRRFLEEMIPVIRDDFNKGRYGTAGVEVLGAAMLTVASGLFETLFLPFQLPAIAVLAIDKWGQEQVEKKIQ